MHLNRDTLIIMSYLKIVVPNVLAVPSEQCVWLSWAMATAPLGLGLLSSAGWWLLVGAAGRALKCVNVWGQEEVGLVVGAVALAAGSPASHWSWMRGLFGQEGRSAEPKVNDGQEKQAVQPRLFYSFQSLL